MAALHTHKNGSESFFVDCPEKEGKKSVTEKEGITFLENLTLLKISSEVFIPNFSNLKVN